MQKLADDLRSSLKGEVRFDDGTRALYATDASNYRQVPIGVVVPKSEEDVLRTLEICRHHGAPVLSRGAGTSLAGQCCNAAVVIDYSRYLNRLIHLNPSEKSVWVEPGLILDNLRNEAEKHGLTFGPDPATHDRCTIGGMIGNNSCGVHSLMSGRTSDNVEELEIVTYGGVRMCVGKTPQPEYETILKLGGRRAEIYRRLKALAERHADAIKQRFPKIPRRVSGYNLDDLLPANGFHVARALTGTEGTCAVILRAKLKLVYSPPAKSLAVLGFPDIYTAADRVPEILRHRPIGLEGMDERLVRYMLKKHLRAEDLKRWPTGKGWLLVEFGGENKQESEEKASRLIADVSKYADGRLMKTPEQARKVWSVRESGLGATARIPGERDTWPGWEDSAVAPEKAGEYLRGLRKLCDKYGYDNALYGHFGQGCIHSRISFDMFTEKGIRDFRSFMNEAADLVCSFGGSLSGEHGDGQSRAELLEKMVGPELVDAFREFKSIWDPDWRMNPGKVVQPNRLDDNLRLGPAFKPWEPETEFSLPQDDGKLSRAVLRCVGVGKCRRESGGIMCPSYMATGEEKHSTRGRARLLFEMMEGSVIKDRWKSEEVKEALDLCLACKGCKTECPVNVDIATYKAEFMSHYYEGKMRPASAYVMGHIHDWAALASHVSGLANACTHSPLIGGLLKKIGGISPERKIPAFAAVTFRSWFRRRKRRKSGGKPVLLWPDTFNNFFYPQAAIAAVEVLEHLGYQVSIPERDFCCGRPLYDYGFLKKAKKMLGEIVSGIGPAAEKGIPVVGLEPSCIAVFKDELLNLFPDDAAARRLSGSAWMLNDFLLREKADIPSGSLKEPVLIQPHCHQRVLTGTEAEETLFAKLDAAVLNAGCCGMAGAFGFETEHFDLSRRIAEREVLPAVRASAPLARIVTDGFSCREQIAGLTNRKPIHSAELLRSLLRSR